MLDFLNIHESTKILTHTSMSISSTFNIENDPQNTQTENGDLDPVINNPFNNADPDVVAREERKTQLKYLNKVSLLLFFQTIIQIIQIVVSILMVVSVSAYIAIINMVFSLLCIGENIIAHQQIIIINLACVTAEVALGFYYVVMTILELLYLTDQQQSSQIINTTSVAIYFVLAICAIAIHCSVINCAGFAFQNFMPNVPVPGQSVKYLHEMKAYKASSSLNDIDDSILLLGHTQIGSAIYLQSQQLRNLANKNVDVKQISIVMGEHDRRKAIIVNNNTIRRGAFKDTSIPEAQSGTVLSFSYAK